MYFVSLYQHCQVMCSKIYLFDSSYMFLDFRSENVFCFVISALPSYVH